jgi:malonyl-CoA O-methyltransferase
MASLARNHEHKPHYTEPMKRKPASHHHFSQRHIRHDFSLHAHEYDTHAQLQQNVLFNALRELEPAFVRDMLMLDVGCGTGYLLELLRHSEVPFSVASCDMAWGMCKEAAERHSDLHNHHVTCADIKALPYAPNSCDMVVSSLTLQWVDDLPAAFAEIHRVLKPGGKAMVTTFGPMTLQELRHAFAKVDDLPHVSHFPTDHDLQQVVQQAGFRVEHFSTEFRTQHYAGVRELMHAIRAIGANNKDENRRKSLTGRKRFMAMEQTYRDEYETARGIPASWEILYLLLGKEEG